MEETLPPGGLDNFPAWSTQMVDEFLQAIPGVLTHRAKKSGVIQLPTHQPILEESNFDANSMVIVGAVDLPGSQKMPCQIVSGQIIIATEKKTQVFFTPKCI